MHNFLSFLKLSMTRPEIFGWFHLMSLSIMIAIIVLIAIFGRKTTEKQHKVIMIVYVTVCLVLEAYKQLVFSYNLSTKTWHYQWYAFPFQFCSTPMYIALASLFVKNQKVKNSLYAFLSTYGLLAGLAVMIYPGDVFTSTIGINIQTMIHHAGQVIIGAYLFIRGKTKIDWKTPIRALPVFAVLVMIALTLNVSVFALTAEKINMFELGPNFPTTLPVFSAIYPNVPHFVFVGIYIIAFTLGAYLVTGVAMLIKLTYNKFSKRKAKE